MFNSVRSQIKATRRKKNNFSECALLYLTAIQSKDRHHKERHLLHECFEATASRLKLHTCSKNSFRPRFLHFKVHIFCM